MDKRTFLKNLSILGLSSMSAIPAMGRVLGSAGSAHTLPEQGDKDYWKKVRNGYRLNSEFINLENGYYCVMPDEILEQYQMHIREVNRLGAYYMRNFQFDNKDTAAGQIAELTGCSPEEVVLTRNTTESLDLVISGQKWQAGDEAVMAYQDYGAMLDMFKQVGERYGVVSKYVLVPPDPLSDDEIVAAYERAITPKTKLLMVCHMINITGHIMPVRKICDMAHRRGVKVMVDGAHALAHIQFSIPDLDCDFYGSSLHKWLSVPLGAGMLYVKKEHIPDMWPIFADYSKKPEDIHRLNHTGTHPVATDLTVSAAIAYYKKIGAENKEERLRYLQRYWTDKVRDLDHVTVNTPTDPKRSCGIANVGVSIYTPAELAEYLMKQYKIYTVAIDNPKARVRGCRIVPNLFTTTDELDILVEALNNAKA